MKRLFFILLVGVAALATARAQDTKPKTQAGDKSILFTMNGFGDFGVSGVVVASTPDSNVFSFTRPIFGAGVRFYLSDNTALRVGLGFNMTSTTTPNAIDTTGNSDATVSQMAFGISPAIELHLVNAGPVSVYTGGMVSFGMASSSSGPDSAQATSSQTGIGVGALLGVEFFPWNNVSIGAEYQLGLMLNSTSFKVGSTSADGPSSTSIGISGPARIVVAFHF